MPIGQGLIPSTCVITYIEDPSVVYIGTVEESKYDEIIVSFLCINGQITF